MRKVGLVFCILAGLFLSFKYIKETRYLTKTEMRQLWAGVTCVNKNQCISNPNAPGGFKHCALLNNYLKCIGRNDYTPCEACDEYFGGENKYCIGQNIGIWCFKQTISCGNAFVGWCYNNICVATNEPIYPQKSCGHWDQCKNE